MDVLLDRRREPFPDPGTASTAAVAAVAAGGLPPRRARQAAASLAVVTPAGAVERRSLFSAYLAALDERSGLVPEEHFPAFWSALRHTLQRELARRGQWDSPPRFLGVVSAETYWTPEALEELATDAYVFLLDRARALSVQLGVKGDVDGLVRLNLRHFVHERQKQHDPLGFRLYEMARAAVEKGVADGFLEAEPAAERIANRTVLLCRRPGAVRELSILVEGWCDELLPDLVTATGKGRHRVVGRLAERLRGLGGAGRVTFKELLDAVKRTVRARWLAVLRCEQGETAFEDGDDALPALVPMVGPDSSYEERQSFEHLLACVGEAVAASGGSAEKQAHLSTLWQFLRTMAAEPDDTVLSGRGVAELLGLPRYRLPELYGELQRLIADCRDCRGCRAAGRRMP